MNRVLFFAFFLFSLLPLTGAERYFLDTAETFRVPRGLFERTREQAERTKSYWIFTEKNNRIIRIEHRPGTGYTPEDTIAPLQHFEHTSDIPPAPVQQFEYAPDGTLLKRTFFTKNGNAALSWKFVSPDSAVYEDIRLDEHIPNDFMPFPDDRFQNIAREDRKDLNAGIIGGFRILPDGENSFSILYLGNGGLGPGSDAMLTYGQKFKTDALGRFLSCTLLDGDGKIHTDIFGVAQYRMAYGNDRLIRMEFLDAAGNLIHNNLGYAFETREYDADGRTSILRFWNTEGNPVMNRAVRAASVRFEYGKDATTLFFLGSDGKPCADVNDSVETCFCYDKQGRISEIRFKSLDEFPSSIRRGDIFRFEYDDRGRVVRRTVFTSAGIPLESEEQTTNTVRDAEGFIKADIFFRADGTESYRFLRMQKENNMGYTANGISSPEGEVFSYYRRSPYGTLISRLHKGSNGFRREFDKRGLLVREYMVNHENKIMFASIFTNDEHGRAKAVRYGKISNRTGKFVYCKNGLDVWETRLQYDRQGNVIREEFFDRSGQSMCAESGESLRVMEFDARGNEIECRFYDTKNAPVFSGETGFFARQTKYDARDNTAAVAWFDTDMLPSPHFFFDGDKKDPNADINESPATATYRYDAADRLLEYNLFAADIPGTLCGIPNAYHLRCVSRRTANGFEAKTQVFDKNDTPVLFSNKVRTILNLKDEYGNFVLEKLLDSEGRETVGGQGYAVRKLVDGVFRCFDAAGREVPAPAEGAHDAH